ncbi:MAG: preprotein translocase subunit YajC [Candidatus Solincola sediminis]|uniref:Preprotein translocase subunit YajC n=1 Tax=Candidatus Solincola sediminis TaxID=1797199 RepID=A0A1F2WFR0_9ACTN|nr:MAG: preprotein translocase subunit YajC [Candidatus Solincola sediminis]OFW58101.1 MAG: preprotein translocase subunit YajC [Candidatus Solincola sediminis]
MNQSAMSILLIVGLIVIFYFMLIRPQQKRMRQQMELMGSLREGDDVMTSSGIYGTVSEVEEDTVILEVAEDVHIRLAKNAVSRVLTEHEPEEEPEEIEEEEALEGEEPETEETEAAEEEQGGGANASGNSSKSKKNN